MKIAVCLSGIVGGTAGTDGAGGLLNPAISHYSYMKRIIEANPKCEFDVFVHTWSTGNEDKIIQLYNPKTIEAEEQRQFNLKGFGASGDGSGTCENYRFRNFSNWYSKYRSLKLKHEYEAENSFKYDWVLQTRFDVWYATPLVFTDYDLDKFYVFNWARGTNPGSEGHSVDVTFFSNSTLMDGFMTHYPNIKKYSKIIPGGIKSYHPVDGHAIPWNFFKDFAGEKNIVHIFREFEDWVIVRKIKHPGGAKRKCPQKLVDEYNHICGVLES